MTTMAAVTDALAAVVGESVRFYTTHDATQMLLAGVGADNYHVKGHIHVFLSPTVPFNVVAFDCRAGGVSWSAHRFDLREPDSLDRLEAKLRQLVQEKHGGRG